MLLRYQHPNFGGNLQLALRNLGLEKDFDRYPLLVKFNWLRPAFHVPIPDSWFANWKNYPFHPATQEQDEAHWADEYDASWRFDEKEIGIDEWFIHPFFRRGSNRSHFLDHAAKPDAERDWSLLHLSEFAKFVPAMDYFYDWQLLRFADIVHGAKRRHPHFWKPGSHDFLVKYARDVSREEFDVHVGNSRWDRWEKAFAWVAHFIAFRDVFEQHALWTLSPQRSSNSPLFDATATTLQNQRRQGAIGLMQWLNVTESDLENALKTSFLELASDWRFLKFDQTADKLPLWRKLQQYVSAAIQWLSLATGKPIYHYLDKFYYPPFYNDIWERLEHVLPYPLWRAAREASAFIRESVKPYESRGISFQSSDEISPARFVELGESVDSLDAYVEAMGRIVDESTHRNNDDPFRLRSRATWYRIMAISADVFLRAAKQKANRQSANGMRGVVDVLGYDGHKWKSQKEVIEKTISSIPGRLESAATGIRKAQSHDELVIAFAIAFYFARNTLTHDFSGDIDFLHADWAGPIFDSVVVFPVWALSQLQLAAKS
jgi:hypothetical protein